MKINSNHKQAIQLLILDRHKPSNVSRNIANHLGVSVQTVGEWRRNEDKKKPYYFTREDKNIIFFAAIYLNEQFCLITEEASNNINEIHHRQPVILNQTDVNKYLNLELSGSSFLKECKKPKLIFHEVSKDVNKPSNNTISLIQKIHN